MPIEPYRFMVMVEDKEEQCITYFYNLKYAELFGEQFGGYVIYRIGYDNDGMYICGVVKTTLEEG